MEAKIDSKKRKAIGARNDGVRQTEIVAPLHLLTAIRTQMPAKKKQAITIPPMTKSKSSSVGVSNKPKLPPRNKDAEGSIQKAPPAKFYWTELEIPFECPSSDCNQVVPANLPPYTITLFRAWSEAIYDYGREALDVLRLETRICLELGHVCILDRARRFARGQGYDKVDLAALPERILRWEADILLLVSDKGRRDACYSWENLLEELKTNKSSLEALEKGKSIPEEVTQQVRPG
jgi:hypothetical protein